MSRFVALWVLMLSAAPADAQSRADSGLSWMLETCAGYFETGKRAVLGTRCAGSEGCVATDLIFRGPAEARSGVEPGAVRVQGPVEISDEPRSGLCEPAPGTGMLTARRGAILGWVEAAVAAGRLRAEDGAYWGCAWNSRRFAFLPQGGPMAAFRFQLNADAPPCAAQGS